MRLTQPHYHDLVIECVLERVIRVAHTFVINGDIGVEPEIRVLVDENGNWVPISHESSPLLIFNRVVGGYQQLCELNPGNTRIVRFFPTLQAEVTTFCTMWAKNINDQQWLERATVTGRAEPDTDHAAEMLS